MADLSKILAAITKLAKGAPETEQAVERARMLPEVIDTTRYAPTALARAALQKPAAQRGFSESLVSQRPPIASMLMRPDDFLSRTPPLSELRDRAILEQLGPSIKKEGLRDLPLLWLDEYPHGVDAGYEGRHRMAALRKLYGNDPVLMNLVKGDRFNVVDSPYYQEPVREWAGDIEASPLELLRRKILFGDQPVDINPLWTGVK